MAYAVIFTRSADKDLERIAPAERGAIIRKAAALADNPRPSGVKKLTGADDLYRIRAGNYRIIYEIADRIITVTVVRIGHRKDVYRKL
jgi:mRNA interferase RelE/StbE